MAADLFFSLFSTPPPPPAPPPRSWASLFSKPPPPLPPPRSWTYLQAFVLLLVAHHVWEIFLKLRTRLRLRKNRGKGVPARLRAAFDATVPVNEEEYARTQAYSLAKNNFGLFEQHVYGLINIGIDMAMAPLLWNDYALRLSIAAGFTAEDEVARMIAMVLLSTPVSLLLSAPTAAYRSFVLEEKFGFNKYTFKSWLYDTVTSALVELVMQVLLMVPLVLVLRQLGEHAWIYAWAFLTAFSLVFNIAYPVLISPLFNTFRPLPEGPMRSGIESLVKQTGLRADKLFEVDGSRQSSHSNAYVSGFFGSKRIVIYDTLLEQLQGDVDAVCSIVAHEIGHTKLSHLWMQLAFAMLQTFATFATYGLCRTSPHLVTDFGFDAPSTYLYLHCFMLLYGSAVQPLLSILHNVFVRQLEFAADRYSARLGYDIRPALTLIDTKNMSNNDPDPLVSICKLSHPPTVQRVEALASLVPPGAKGSKLKKQ